MRLSEVWRRSLVLVFSLLACLPAASASGQPDLMHTVIDADRVTMSNGEFVPRFANYLPQSKIVAPGEVWVVPADSTWDAIEVQSGGKVVLDQTRDTVLRFTHLMNLPGGEIEMIVPCGRRAELIVRNVPIDTTRDPYQWGNGLLNFGKMTRLGCSMPMTWIPALGDVRAGEMAITLKQAPAGWRVGDELIVPDTASPKWPVPQPRRESPLTIAGINGSTIALSKPLDFDHLAIRDPDGDVHMTADIANFSRNLVIRSEDSSGTPGHTATIGHQASFNIQYNEFRGLGRTNAIPLDTTSPRPVPLEKQIGRYADHMHHTQGFNSISRGNSYRGHPKTKWGLALHRTSDARAEWNVCVDFVGACFVTEEGDEVRNVISDNFAAYVTGGAADFTSPLANLSPSVNCPGCEGAALWIDGLISSTIERNHVWNSNFGGMLIPSVKAGALAPSVPGGALNTPIGFPDLLPASVSDNAFVANIHAGLEFWGIGNMFPVTRAFLANNTVQQFFAEVTVPNVRFVDTTVLCDTVDELGLRIGKPYVGDFRFEGGQIRGCGFGLAAGGGNLNTLFVNTLFQNRQDIQITEPLVTDGNFTIVNTTHKPIPGLPQRAIEYVQNNPWQPPAQSSSPAEIASCRHKILNLNGTGLNYCLSAPRLRPVVDPFNAARADNGARAYASTEHSWGEPYFARGANDGDRLGTDWGFGPTYYWGGVWASSAGAPQWLAVDFGTMRTIDRVTLYFTQDTFRSPVTPTADMTCGVYCPQDFEVQTWTGATWQTVPGGVFTGNNKVMREATFAPVATSQVRVLITKAGQRLPISLVELEARSTTAIPPLQFDPAIPRIEDAFGHIFTLVNGAVLRNGIATTIAGVANNIAVCQGSAYLTTDGATWQKYQGPSTPRWATAPFSCDPTAPVEPPPVLAPVITAQPASQTINSGQSAQLSISVNGSSPLTYQWYLGVAGNFTSPVVGAFGPAFSTPPLTTTTDYWVRVSNSAGSVNSLTAKVTVMASPPPSNPGGFVDGEGAAWTFGPQGETLRNGIQAGGGLGLEYRVCNGSVYVVGINFVWHRYTGGANGSWIPFENPPCSSSQPPPTPPADSDGDGIPDAADQCPTLAGIAPAGCPPPPSNPGELVDGEGAVWTFGPQGQTLRNGIQAGGGLGLEYRICNGSVYVVGINFIWHQYTGGANGTWVPFLNPPCASSQPPAPPADGDGDGVPDTIDQCPTQPAGTANGCPLPAPSDGDGDGVPDSIDQCPTQPGATSNGCPAPPSQPDGPVDGEGAVWTFGPQGETLRNGVQAGGGYGLTYLLCNGTMTVLGTNWIWHSYSGGAGGGWTPLFSGPACTP